MNIQTPIEATGNHFLNKQIEVQSKKWDVEAHFLEFEQTLDTLDIMSDGLPDDPKLSNALNALHSKLSQLYLTSKAHIDSEAFK